MNLYRVNIHSKSITGIYGESFHVQASTARTAMDKAYRKFDKRYPKEKGTMVLHSLALVEENF